MCGIVAYSGQGSAQPVLLTGLERLEYRGYDSAGIGVVSPGGEVHRTRSVGGVAALDDALRSCHLPSGHVGVGHTRWATHGEVCTENAHPFTGCKGRVLVALNGIIENHAALRRELIAAGHEFESTTDAEVVAHLLEDADPAGLAAAVAAVAARLEGHFAFVVAHAERPRVVVGHRNRCPLVVATSLDEAILASSSHALAGRPSRIMSIDDGDTVEAEFGVVTVTDRDGQTVERPSRVSLASQTAPDVGSHDSFMWKEILEQPEAIRATLTSAAHTVGRIPTDVERVIFTGCGTSQNAALVGRALIERWAGIPCEVEGAAEWPDRIALGPTTLVVAMTQSGETADTIAALNTAADQGAQTCVVTNVADSLAARQADGLIEIGAGPEVAVAATKTFVAQITALGVLAVHLGVGSGALDGCDGDELLRAVGATADRIGEVLDADGHIRRVAKLLADAPYAMYLGRAETVPVALEGALKIKEIAYLPVEALSAGEMKHGPLALIDSEVPVVVAVPSGPAREKTLANMHEVEARGGRIIAVTDQADDRIYAVASEVIEVPMTDPLLTPIVSTVALQLLAYHTARHRGLDPDRPRNLAKTVTVG